MQYFSPICESFALKHYYARRDYIESLQKRLIKDGKMYSLGSYELSILASYIIASLHLLVFQIRCLFFSASQKEEIRKLAGLHNEIDKCEDYQHYRRLKKRADFLIDKLQNKNAKLPMPKGHGDHQALESWVVEHIEIEGFELRQTEQFKPARSKMTLWEKSS